MKLKVLIIFLALFFISTANSEAQNQKIGYFESEVILAQIPEYQGIEQRLQLLSDGWEQELNELDAEILALEEDYKAKEILYTEEIRQQKRNEIQQKKLARDTFLNQKFGPEGEYFQNQRDLLEPIQRQIFTALRTVAQKQGFDYVFDRSGDLYMVYARGEWNLNEAILLELGIEIE
ncbi:MAG: OmpH family outer membrane protein [Balneola sp.]|nr:MAG: OmpH family outer membrane protein [Balneola sp.]